MDKIIAVDFDGTLCENAYPAIGKPIQHTINRLLNEQKNGAKIILWTCRVDNFLTEAIEWCRDRCIVFDTVNDNLPSLIEAFGNNTRKVCATEYWDDHAVNPITAPLNSALPRVSELIDKLFSHNEIIALWYDDLINHPHESCLLWRGEAWSLPDRFKDQRFIRFMGLVSENIEYSDTINILVTPYIIPAKNGGNEE